MPVAPLNPMVQQLFQQPQLQTANNPAITRGSLIMFHYTLWIHDPMPLVIVTDYLPGNKLRGVNLHYLTYPFVRTLLSQAGTTAGFSYQNIKGNAYISDAFRSYKWNGISQVKKFDCQFVLQMMTMARAFDPSQIRAIRQSVDQQLQQQMLPKAEETSFPQVET